ncbi:polysaccharide pyruvyl transferase family protein [Pontibacter chitinilyticus]|uniref:polysaccharide pyruvyl transferase family protein n=1 Tax=Pontibacter chitinilyticus TaxID=2674989 RepID=UPI00321B7454
MSSTIALLDPSLEDQKGTLSNNLGDVIIYESVSNIIKELFPNDEIIRISTHDYLEPKHKRLIKDSKYAFIGGSNLLSSDLKTYNQWKVSRSRFYYYLPGLSNLILLGVGWWQYQHNPTFTTKFFYSSVLSGKRFHSVRDGYTLDKMKKMGINNTLNTSCITSWKLQGLEVNKRKINKSCLFTLTDYNQNPELDNKLIDLLVNFYTNGIHYFPQGSRDEEYIKTLDSYKKNKSIIKIINRSNESFYDMLSQDVDYIGTRLHGGVKCLQRNMDALIIAVDNRALEISKDINLPVVKRDDFESIIAWIEGKQLFSPINLPLESIAKWKSQFNG